MKKLKHIYVEWGLDSGSFKAGKRNINSSEFWNVFALILFNMTILIVSKNRMTTDGQGKKICQVSVNMSWTKSFLLLLTWGWALVQAILALSWGLEQGTLSSVTKWVLGTSQTAVPLIAWRSKQFFHPCIRLEEIPHTPQDLLAGLGFCGPLTLFKTSGPFSQGRSQHSEGFLI